MALAVWPPPRSVRPARQARTAAWDRCRVPSPGARRLHMVRARVKVRVRVRALGLGLGLGRAGAGLGLAGRASARGGTAGLNKGLDHTRDTFDLRELRAWLGSRVRLTLTTLTLTTLTLAREPRAQLQLAQDVHLDLRSVGAHQRGHVEHLECGLHAEPSWLRPSGGASI